VISDFVNTAHIWNVIVYNPSMLLIVILNAVGCLEFVHIPKTGGSSVEGAACKEGVSWGACHYEGHEHCIGCIPDQGFCRIDGGSPWHAPALLHNGVCGILGYKHCETFAVVRDPIEWAVSHYHCRFWGPKGAVEMNVWMRDAHKRWIPQHEYLPVTYVIRHEGLAASILRLTNMTLGHVQVSKHRRGTLTRSTICAVARFFKRDYEVFKYAYPSYCL
jgi:hypothetical protein